MKGALKVLIICISLIVGVLSIAYSQPVYDYEKHYKKQSEIKRLDDKHQKSNLDLYHKFQIENKDLIL